MIKHLCNVRPIVYNSRKTPHIVNSVFYIIIIKIIIIIIILKIVIIILIIIIIIIIIEIKIIIIIIQELGNTHGKFLSSQIKYKYSSQFNFNLSF